MSGARRVLVTGVGSGLGTAIATVLAEAGCRVVGTVRTGGAHPDPRVAVVEVDMRDRVALDQTVTFAVSHLGGLDALVCNAGVQGLGSLEALTDVTWDETLAVNLTAPVLLARAALPHLCEAGGGTIVLIGSVHGRATVPGRIAYAASKAGLEGLTRALAVDLAPNRIRTVAVCPGPFNSPALRAAAARFHPGEAPDEALRSFARSQPSGQIGAPADLGHLINFLIGDAARFLSGATITLDGGQTAQLVTPRMGPA